MEYSYLIGETAKAHINYVNIADTLGITRDTLNSKGRVHSQLKKRSVFGKIIFQHYNLNSFSLVKHPFDNQTKQRKDKYL